MHRLPYQLLDHLTIPQVNLSISGYEPDSLRTSHMRSPSMRAQEISIMPQLDGPVSLPMRDPTGRRIQEIPRSAEWESSQGGTYVQRASASRWREYPGGNSKNDGSRRPHRDWRPLREGDIQTKVEDPLAKEDSLIEDLLMMKDPLEEDILLEMEDPLEEEDTLVEDPLMKMEDPLIVEDLLVMKDPLDLLVDKDCQALKDHLYQ